MRRILTLAAALTFAASAAAQTLETPDDGSEEKLGRGWTAPTGGEGVVDLARGEKLWNKCRACHTKEQGARHSVGPNLFGVFGRPAGAAVGYNYSPALRESGIVWTDENLNSYLAATQEFLPGNKMYGGLAIPRDRTDLLAWLKTVAGGGAQ